MRQTRLKSGLMKKAMRMYAIMLLTTPTFIDFVSMRPSVRLYWKGPRKSRYAAAGDIMSDTAEM